MLKPGQTLTLARVCEGVNCREEILPGLQLRFCKDCRLNQPMPTKRRSRYL